MRAHIDLYGYRLHRIGAKDVLAKFEVELKAKKLREEVSLIVKQDVTDSAGSPLVIIYPEELSIPLKAGEMLLR